MLFAALCLAAHLLACGPAPADLSSQDAADLLGAQQAVVRAAIGLLPHSPDRAADLLSGAARRLWRLGETYPGAELVDETLRRAAGAQSPQEMQRLAEVALEQMANVAAALTHSGPAGARTDEAGRTIVGVLGRPEFRQQQRQSAFQRWLLAVAEAILDAVDRLSGALGYAGWLVIAVAVVIGAILLALLILFIARMLPHLLGLLRGKRRVVAEEPAPRQGPDLGPAAADRALRRAREFAERGDWLEALRQVFWALLLRLDAAEVVDFRGEETNWTYVRQVRAEAPAASPAVERATRLFEARWYGEKSAAREDYETALGCHDEARGALEAAHGPQ